MTAAQCLTLCCDVLSRLATLVLTVETGADCCFCLFCYLGQLRKDLNCPVCGN